MADNKFPDKKTSGDHVLAAARGALGAIPFGGAAATEVLSYVFTPPLLERQREWFDDLGERVARLESERGITLDQLRDNQAFLDAVATATQSALRTSSQTKKEALRNAVVNAALPRRPELAVQQIFLAITDRFSELHLVMLRFAQNATQFRTPTGDPLPQRRMATEVLEDAFPESRSKPDLYKLIWNDLFASGLVKLPNLENGYEGDARAIRRTSELGDQYLAFIASPLSSVRRR
ncbi:MAG TPA: hypothetical protein VGJ29_11030 [Vicinamibacterales bacterium]|jgi:hypothetical protein